MVTPIDYGFAARPKWIAGHLIAVLAIVVFVIAGFWQLDRLAARRAQNELLETRSVGAPIALPPPASVARDPAQYEWQLVEFEATWNTSDEVILQAQSLAGVSGHDVVTPAEVDGSVVLVNRGWVPIDVSGPPVAEAAPTARTATVLGLLRISEERGRFGPVDAPTGRLDRISRVDVARLESQVDSPVYPMWVQLIDQTPEPGFLPELRPLPEMGEGPHLSYAVQWFLFAGVVAVGYPILLRRTARQG
jgi:surfeit locus 1 family protein